MKSFGKSLIILEKRLDSLLFMYTYFGSLAVIFIFFVKIEHLDKLK